MHQINQRISGLKFDIQAGETYEGVIALSSGRCDLLMVYHSPLVPMSIDEKLSPSITLGKDKLVPVSQADEFGSPMHRLIESKLRQLPLLSFPPETFFGRICNGIIRFRPSDPNFNVMVQSANARVLHTLALEGLGIAWLPERCIANDIAEGRLALAGDDEWSAKIDIRLYASHERARLLNANLLDNIRDLKHENLAVR
jgi:DNA-binding transcriptional LysR family regulator